MILHSHSISSIFLLAGSPNNAVWFTLWPCKKSEKTAAAGRAGWLPLGSLSVFYRVHRVKPHCRSVVKMHKSETAQMTCYSLSSKILRLSGNIVNYHIIFK